MVRIVHTADIHLDPDAPERFDAFQTVLSCASTHDADAVTIGGDLFDSDVAAEQLRPELRGLCSELPFPIYVIPGNHDFDAYTGDRYFGSAVVSFVEEPFSHLTIKDLRLTALPYTSHLNDDRLLSLRERTSFDGPEVLLIHCSLEAPLSTTAGEEESVRYCPVTASTLAELGFDYILAGHYHSPHLTDIGPRQQFVYPGTPASVTRAETGQRTVALLDTAMQNPLQLETIDTFRYVAERIDVSPGKEESALAELESIAKRVDGHAVDGRVVVTGLISWDETRFAEALAISAGSLTIENTTRSISHVTAHPLWEECATRIDDLVEENDQAAVEALILDCMAKVKAEGNLR